MFNYGYPVTLRVESGPWPERGLSKDDNFFKIFLTKSDNMSLSWLSVMMVSAVASSCSTDEFCNLNGLCNKGSCECNPGWHGSNCSQVHAGRKTGRTCVYILPTAEKLLAHAPLLFWTWYQLSMYHSCSELTVVLITTGRACVDNPANSRKNNSTYITLVLN